MSSARIGDELLEIFNDGSNNLRPGGHGVGEPSVMTGEQVLSAYVVRALPLILALSETLEYLSYTFGEAGLWLFQS